MHGTQYSQPLTLSGRSHTEPFTSLVRQAFRSLLRIQTRSSLLCALCLTPPSLPEVLSCLQRLRVPRRVSATAGCELSSFALAQIEDRDRITILGKELENLLGASTSLPALALDFCLWVCNAG